MKHIIILIVLLSAFYGAFSQSPINIGIKAGINSSSLIHNIDDFFDQSQANNYLVGVFARITFSKVYLQPEAYFNAKGGILSSPDPFYSLITEEITYNTIDVPILLGYKLIDKPMFNFRVNIGPVLSWVTTEPMIEELSDLNINELKDNYLSIQAGIGMDIWMISLDARVETSSNIFIDKSNYSASNRVYLITAGIKLF